VSISGDAGSVWSIVARNLPDHEAIVELPPVAKVVR
jgi:hypothetical protein